MQNLSVRPIYSLVAVVLLTTSSSAQTLRNAATLENQLKATPLKTLVQETRLRGDAARGALVFYKSAAGCIKCHVSGEGVSPLGPDMTLVGKTADGKTNSDEHLIESLLFPSKSIRKGFETVDIVDIDGNVVRGLLVRRDADKTVLRNISDLSVELSVRNDEIDQQRFSEHSLMPDGLMATITEQRDFWDLAAYVITVARGGKNAAQELRPTKDQLAVKDDSVNLDHAGIIKKLRSRDFETGKGIYHGYCFNCHGNDGNTPSLPTARAFGTQKLKFGADTYSMFMTLTRGNGLMAPMSHLTPKERYQVVHYIREAFMKGKNPDYKKVTSGYLSELPKGTENGTYTEAVERNYGPALASQLHRKFTSVLTVKVGQTSIAYDLNSMDQAGIWRDGFLDLSDTQHARDRGEGTAKPAGKPLDRLAGWRWGHDGRVDYHKEDLNKRGPIPSDWMKYRGHHLHGDQVVLSYQIDRREVLETVAPGANAESLVHTLMIGPGTEIVLCVSDADLPGGKAQLAPLAMIPEELASDPEFARLYPKQLVAVNLGTNGSFVANSVRAPNDATRWEVDGNSQQIRLRIPASKQAQRIEISRAAGDSLKSLGDFYSDNAKRSKQPIADPQAMTKGGAELWPNEIKTVGYLGLERDGYALDTITIPEKTPWNTWFRTSAIDFFSDGRMAVATYGGDVWIVSGVDDALQNLRWKRFAGGLYEPFGLRVVNDQIYVTCKDRLTRLHDHDGNGEADFYESFNADPDVSVNFHAFNFDLQSDAEGNLYYAKSGHGSDSYIPGCVVKISPDGSQRSVYCTGFRTPNGMGILPDGRVTASDNQGQWTPAGKISLLKNGGFYGWVNNYSIPGKWEPGEGTIDLEKIKPPKTFDPPLVWMPQEFDNSSGGQLFVDDPRFGPLSGKLLHTSFGKGWMSYLMMQDFGDVAQAAIIKLPFDFRTGIMRARVNPADGQVYATGLQGWNGGGRIGLKGQGVQRLRYTGRPHRIVSDCQVESNGLRIQFNFQLDAKRAASTDAFKISQWNYKWAKSYGSQRYKPSTGKVGIDEIPVRDVKILDGGKAVKLIIDDLKPVNQMRLVVDLADEGGKAFSEEIYWTINRVPKK